MGWKENKDSQNSLWPRTTACTLPFALLWKWEGWGKEKRGEEKRKWQTQKTILPFVELVVCEPFKEEGRWRFLERMLFCGPRSKLSPCWKITALHDRSTSLSTLLFTFLLQAGSDFTFSGKPASAIYHLQPEAPTRSLLKPSADHLHLWSLTFTVSCSHTDEHHHQHHQGQMSSLEQDSIIQLPMI